MKELQKILKAIDSLPIDEDAVLATVVDVKGSSYRLPGAKMLILENGKAIGTVSGGCLEADVLERAKQVLETGSPQIFTYDTTNNEDSVFSFNMGCQGVIRILLEAVKNNPFIEFLRKCFSSHPGVVSTVIVSNNGEKIGERLFFDQNGVSQNESEDDLIRTKAMSAFETRESSLQKYEFGEVFIEYISPPINIKIFGAGADAVPLAEIAKNLGWHVTVVDHRPTLANRERFENPDEIILARPEEINDNVDFGNDPVAIVMTHNYDHDKEILRVLIGKDLTYIGLLGPKVRTENILRELRESSVKMSETKLAQFYAPVGLDIGAQLPETIALSIIAEIQAVLTGRDGGFLKYREGSIYGRD